MKKVLSFLIFMLFMSEQVKAQHRLLGCELWFDGSYGSKYSRAIDSVNKFSLDSVFSTSTLTNGMHTLNIRFRSEDSLWSSVQTSYFLKTLKTSADSGIAAYESWFDMDYTHKKTGTFGNQNIANLNEVYNADSLSPGMHTINFRFRGDDGLWSSVQTSYFLKTLKTSADSGIAAYESWFDMDYTHKKTGTFGNQNRSNLNEVYNADSLSPGMHMINFRFRGDDGLWSSVQTSYFLKTLKTSADSGIAVYESWFDNDYSHKKTSTFGNQTIANFNNVYNADSLSPGMHTINYRFRGDDGLWSSVQTSYFLKTLKTSADSGIAAYESWFDTDYSNKQTGILGNHTVTSFSESYELNKISSGMHTFNIRYRGDDSLWSSVQTSYFLKTFSAGLNTEIIAYRYWFDKGTTTPIEVKIKSPSNNLNFLPEVKIHSLDSGNFVLYFQTKDSSGLWSSVISGDFRKHGRPKIIRINPNKGGNTGDVTVNIYGDGFYPGCRVKLIHGTDTIYAPDSLTSIAKGNQIITKFNLRGADTATYDVVVENPEADTIMVLVKGFKVMEGIEPSPYVTIIGSGGIRTGQWQTYTLSLGNKGNNNAQGVPFWISFPKNVKVDLRFDVYNGAKTKYNLNSFPESYRTDSLFGMPYPDSVQIFGFFVPEIAPNQDISYQIAVQATTNQNFEIMTWTSPEIRSNHVMAYNMDCIADGAYLALGIAVEEMPVVDCIVPAAELVTKAIAQYQTPGRYGLGDFVAMGLETAWECGKYAFPPAILADKIVAGIFAFHDGYQLGKKCLTNKNPLFKLGLQAINSYDPNDKYGPSGYSGSEFFNPSLPLTYQIHFENVDSATAPAQTVTVIDTLDKSVFDLSSFQFGLISVGDTLMYPTPGLFSASSEVDLSPKGINELCRVKMTLDTAKGIVKWEFASLEPFSEEPISDPYGGFLPPNQTAPEGEGSVTYSVKLKPNLPMNTVIANKAYIIFDNNPPIITPEWVNKLDILPPMSKVDSLPAIITDSIFTVRWNGQDSGSGVLNYSIYYSVNGGAYKPWLRNVDFKSFEFKGILDSCYSFYSIASDTALNTETKILKAETHTILVKKLPVIQKSGATTFCEGDSVILIAPTSLKYKWSTGDTTQQISVKVSGSYAVTLIGKTMCDVKTEPVVITVHPKPIVSFTNNKTAQCLSGNSFVFTNSSTISSGSLTYQWAFGDGNSSTSTNPSHSYNSAGSYSVKLISSSSFGCKDSVSKMDTVHPKPTVNFAINKTAQCLSGNSFVFTNSSTISSGSLTHKWTFGDGNNSASTNPSHSYNSAGTYSVKLISTSDFGCKDSISKLDTVHPKPAVNFVINKTAQCLSGNSFDFTNSSTISSGSLTHQWIFGDGNSSTSTNPSHSYNSTGSYSVKLISLSSFGCKDSVSKLDTVHPKPIVSFNINKTAQCLSGNSFVFNNGSTISSGTLTHQWTFGDGNNSTSTNPSNSYNSAGTYSVKLISTSNFGCKDSVSKMDTVHPKPTVNFSINKTAQCISGNSFDFTNSSTISSGSLTHQWTFGDGNSSTSTNPSHSYNSAGSYSVKLISSSSFGCKDSVSRLDTVHPKPTVSFTINKTAQCISGNSFEFTNGSTISSGTLSYRWTFGDGNNNTSTNPSNSYNSAGTYSVKLISTSGFGCKDSISKLDTVHPKPTVNFSINKTAQCVSGNSFEFTNGSTISTGTITQQWTFGDGNNSTSTNPSNSYNSAGTYSVKLISTSGFGCKDSISKLDTVHPKPTVNFTINKTAQCLSGNSFVFTNGSTISSGSLTHQWTFGDGNNSASTNPSNSYNSAGTYLVKLISTSGFGCKDSISKLDTVHPKPIVNFTINKTAQCLSGNNFVFSNGSTISSGTLTHQWTFGDGNNSTSTNPSNSYNSAGTYLVKLISTSGFGCKDSISKLDTVHPKPTVNFSINKTAQCLSGNSFMFTNSSTISSGTLSYKWTFGDGNNSTSSNPSNSYNSAGTFSVKLINTSDFGCRDSISYSDTVHPQAVINFKIENDSQCVSDNKFSFEDLSTITSGTLKRQWKFGDGVSDFASPIFHSYLNDGKFDIQLSQMSDKGCTDTISKFIIVHPNPVVNFSINDSVQCFIGNDFKFTNGSTVKFGGLSYNWNLGENRTSSLTSPTNTYTFTGTYNVKLIAGSIYGCKDSTTKNVTINENPKKPSIQRKGVFLETDADTGIEWFHKGILIQGENKKLLPAKESGHYHVMVTNKHGCHKFSDSLNYNYSATEKLGIIILPNPNRGEFTVTSLTPMDKIEIIDLIGKTIYSESNLNGTTLKLININVSNASYFVRVYAGGNNETLKINVIR